MDLSTFLALTGELAALVAMVAPLYKNISKVKDGQKCQLRSEMLRIYYRHQGDERIRQYEYENFVALYYAYKALGGNSFIDKIYKEVQTWTVLP